jgi:hypothetical protein
LMSRAQIVEPKTTFVRRKDRQQRRPKGPNPNCNGTVESRRNQHCSADLCGSLSTRNQPSAFSRPGKRNVERLVRFSGSRNTIFRMLTLDNARPYHGIVSMEGCIFNHIYEDADHNCSSDSIGDMTRSNLATSSSGAGSYTSDARPAR